MNKGFYNNIDENFEHALVLSEKEFNHSELFEYLRNGNIPQKQIAALKLDNILNEEEGKILISNLTGCDGKIREAVALKISQLLNENNNISKYFIYPEIFADATIDINANICRLVVDSVLILKDYDGFKEKYIDKIISFIEEAFKNLDSFIYKDKKYTINKQLFKLYWCLEGLKPFVKDIDEELLLKIIERAVKETEYTIREKVAQIVVLIDSDKFTQIKEQLINDENYYVRMALKH